MITTEPDFEQLLQTLDELRPDELELVEKHIANLKKRNRRSFPPKTPLDDETFLMPYEDYLALSDAAREKIQLCANDKYRSWIDEELARHRAQWMIVCGGKIVERSTRFHDQPSREKLNAIGMQTGCTPFVLVGNIYCEGDWLTFEAQKRLRKFKTAVNN